jgi:hypothetical protein
MGALPGHSAYPYYGRPEQAVDEAPRISALEKFAGELLRATEDSPQGVVEMVNRHFWDLL